MTRRSADINARRGGTTNPASLFGAIIVRMDIISDEDFDNVLAAIPTHECTDIAKYLMSRTELQHLTKVQIDEVLRGLINQEEIRQRLRTLRAGTQFADGRST